MSAPLWFWRNTNSAGTNNKTNKMKKILLLLSCFFATWCSVQAGLKSSASSDMMQSSSLLAGAYDADGQIKSATYDANYSEIYVTYSLRNASSAKLGLLSTSTGGIVAEYSLGVNASSKSCRVDSKLEEGLYVLLLYVNGNIRSNMDVTITAGGKINGFSPSLDNSKLTVSYAFEHAAGYNASLRIFNGSSLVKKVSISNPNTTSSITFDSYSLTAGKTYTFKLYSGEKEIKPSSKNYTMPLRAGEILALSHGTNSITVDYILKYVQAPTILISEDGSDKVIKGVGISNSSTSKRVTIENLPLEIGKTYKVAIYEHGGQGEWSISKTITIGAPSVITGLKYENGRIKVDFTLEKRGVNVGFKLISTRTGRAYDYNYGYCGQNSGSYSLSLPSDDNGYHGNIIYVVLLTVNGQIKADKQIMIAR